MDILKWYICSFLGPSKLGQIGNFSSEIGKKNAFGIGNGAEFRQQIRKIESPEWGTS